MLIAICGEMGSGKDSCAEILCEERGFCHMSLAQPMKQFCAEVFGWDERRLYGPSMWRNQVDPKWGVSARHVLQQLGTGWGREMHPDLWVNYLLSRVGQQTNGPAVVVSDVRFRNEVDRIKEFGGHVIKIVRPGLAKTEHSNHASEQEQAQMPDDLFELVIVNDGTIDDLKAKVLAYEAKLCHSEAV